MNNTILAPSLTSKPAVVNGPKVGDILVSTYGYDACIASFAKVVGVTKSSVKIQMIGHIEDHTGPMTWNAMPDFNRVGEEVSTRRFKAYGDSYSVKSTSFSNFYPWSGKPISCYNYH